jgi:hypothetical protein
MARHHGHLRWHCQVCGILRMPACTKWYDPAKLAQMPLHGGSLTMSDADLIVAFSAHHASKPLFVQSAPLVNCLYTTVFVSQFFDPSSMCMCQGSSYLLSIPMLLLSPSDLSFLSSQSDLIWLPSTGASHLLFECYFTACTLGIHVCMVVRAAPIESLLSIPSTPSDILPTVRPQPLPLY